LNAPMEVRLTQVVGPIRDEGFRDGPEYERRRLFHSLFRIFARHALGIRLPRHTLKIDDKQQIAATRYVLSGSVMGLIRPLANLRRSHARIVEPFDRLQEPLWHAVGHVKITYNNLPICDVETIDEIDP